MTKQIRIKLTLFDKIMLGVHAIYLSVMSGVLVYDICNNAMHRLFFEVYLLFTIIWSCIFIGKFVYRLIGGQF